MNVVAVVGRLVADPELRYTNQGTAVASARIAVDGAGSFISEDEGYGPGFFNVTVWGKQAENFAEYCYKGREVGIDGRLSSRTYDSTKHEGERVYVVEIVANRVQFLREPAGEAEQAPQQEPPKQQGRNGGGTQKQGTQKQQGNAHNQGRARR